MRTSSRLTVAALLILSLAASGCKDEGGGGAEAQRIGELINISGDARIDLPGRVSMLIQVRDQHGGPYTGLTAADFRLFENGVAISPTEAQQQLLPLPRVYQLLSFLLLDLSSSISQDPGALAAEIAAAKAYIDVVTQDPAQRISIAFFFGADDIVPAEIRDPATGQYHPLGFSSDQVLLKEALDNVDRIEVFDDSTNLYGGVIQAAAELEDEEFAVGANDDVEFVSTALVTFTDGSHNANDIRLDEAVASLDGVGVAFSIGVGSETDRDALRALGPDGFVFVDDLSELEDTFKDVGQSLSDEANSFYRIAYISPKNNGARDPILRVETAAASEIMLETTFSARYFSAGAGFLNPVSTDAVAAIEGGCEDIAIDTDDGSYFIVTEATGAGITVGHMLDDGTGDPNFGTRGVAYLPADSVGSNYALHGVAIAVSPLDGTVYGLAQRTSTISFASNIVVLLIEADGTFQITNLPPALTGNTSLIDQGADIAIDASGRVLIGGAASGVTGSHRLLVRLTTGLALDATFGTGGVVTHVANGAFPTDEIVALILDGTRILTIGEGFNNARGGRDLQIVAFDDDGLLDTTYGTGGLVDNWAVFGGSALDGIGEVGGGVLEPTSGDLLVAGSVSLKPGSGTRLESAALWRLDPNGDPVPAFVGGFTNPFGPGEAFEALGIVTLGAPLTQDPDVLFGRGSWFNSVALRDDGNFIAAGARDNADSHFDAVWMSTTPDGLLRSTYNGTGFFIDDGAVFDDGDEEVFAVVVQPGGPALSCGRTSMPGSRSGVPLVFRDEDARRD